MERLRQRYGNQWKKIAMEVPGRYVCRPMLATCFGHVALVHPRGLDSHSPTTPRRQRRQRVRIFECVCRADLCAPVTSTENTIKNRYYSFQRRQDRLHRRMEEKRALLHAVVPHSSMPPSCMPGMQSGAMMVPAGMYSDGGPMGTAPMWLPASATTHAGNPGPPSGGFTVPDGYPGYAGQLYSGGPATAGMSQLMYHPAMMAHGGGGSSGGSYATGTFTPSGEPIVDGQASGRTALYFVPGALPHGQPNADAAPRSVAVALEGGHKVCGVFAVPLYCCVCGWDGSQLTVHFSSAGDFLC